MRYGKSPRTALWLVLTISVLSPTLAAQTRRANTQRKLPPRTAPKEVAPNFDTLLAANSYKIYGEIRGVGQFIRSAGVNDLLDPLIKFAAPPKEFRTLVKWLNLHADELTSSRLLFAGWPARSELPQFICAIEFANEEEAAKFEPKLNTFLPKVFATPVPSPSPSEPQSSPSPNKGTTENEPTIIRSADTKPSYLLKHSGTLVLLSDSPFTFKDLRPSGTKLLRDDESFRLARDRFNTEPLFLYVDVKTEDRSRSEPPPVEKPAESKFEVTTLAAPDEIREEAIADVPIESAQETVDPPPTQDSETAPAIDMNFWRLTGFLSEGRPRWPDAVGVGAVFESEEYVLRALFVNSEENKGIVIPFMPQLLSGPALSPAVASVLPANTQMFVSASVDFGQMHDDMVKSAEPQQNQWRHQQRSVSHVATVSPFEPYEKLLGISIKKDLIPLLGNEVAVSFPMETFFGRRRSAQREPSSETDPKRDAPPDPPAIVVAVSLRDREGMRALLPKVVDALGIKGASALAQTERREDTELVSYGNSLSYAFVGDFLIGSTDAKAVRGVVDSYLNRQTLASDASFHNFTRWQPRQVLGQVYVSTALSESYEDYAASLSSISDEKLRDFMSGLTPANEPITYALSNEGLGPLHELHLPRKLVLMMIAGMSAGSKHSPLDTNESIAQGGLQMIASAEESFKSTQGDGRYGSLQELIDAGLIPSDTADRYGYKIDVVLLGDGFEARATPNEYGKTGKRSYYIDQTSVLRAGDHGGGPATVADNPPW